MPSIEILSIFFTAVLIMHLSPGPSNLYVMSVSISHGGNSGAIAALGLAVGGLVHILAATLGLSALFAYYPSAYTAMKLVGAAYLIYLGLNYALGNHSITLQKDEALKKTHGRIFRESALVEITNPKVALFFMVFLPQFVDNSAGNPALQIFGLGMIVMITALPIDFFVAYGSSGISKWLLENTGIQKIQARISGGILICLGGYMALAG